MSDVEVTRQLGDQISRNRLLICVCAVRARGLFLYQFASLSALISDTPHAPPCREFRPLRTPVRRNCNGVRIHREFHLQAQNPFCSFPSNRTRPFHTSWRG